MSFRYTLLDFMFLQFMLIVYKGVMLAPLQNPMGSKMQNGTQHRPSGAQNGQQNSWRITILPTCSQSHKWSVPGSIFMIVKENVHPPGTVSCIQFWYSHKSPHASTMQNTCSNFTRECFKGELAKSLLRTCRELARHLQKMQKYCQTKPQNDKRHIANLL